MSCNCTFNNDIEVINKIKAKGFEDLKLSTSHHIICECKTEILMDTCLTVCPNCQNLYGVTPCSQDNIENVVCIKKGEY